MFYQNQMCLLCVFRLNILALDDQREGRQFHRTQDNDSFIQFSLPINVDAGKLQCSSWTAGESPCMPPITAPMCKALNYNRSSFPNDFSNSSPEEAALEVHQFWSLVEIQCSEHLQDFLCSLYFPSCDDGPGLRQPCKQLCEAARPGYDTLINNYGFQWPKRMNCETFLDGSNTPEVCFMGKLAASITATPEPHPRFCATDVTLPSICKNVNYDVTSFPNSLGHREPTTAMSAMIFMLHLLQHHCQESLKRFLCYVYFPVCIPGVGNIPPCRRMCLAVRNECGVRVWPTNLSCDQFPPATPGEGAECMDFPPSTTSPSILSNAPVTKRPGHTKKPNTNRRGISFRKFLIMFRKSLGQVNQDLASLQNFLDEM